MRDIKEVFSELTNFYGNISKVTFSISIDDDRTTFIKLRDEVKEHCPEAPLFNRKTYFPSDFDYKYPQMQEESIEMLVLLSEEMNSSD